MDDPNPELGPALEPLVAGLACQLEGAAEELELARILLALGEKGRVEGPTALLRQPGLGTQELPSGRFCVGRACKERLLVQEVRPFERIVGQLEGLVPPSLSTQHARVVHAE